MSFITTRPRVLALGAVCAAAGAGAGAVADAGASTGHGSSTSPTRTRQVAMAPRGLLRRLARHTVQARLVVHTPKGFKTVTINRGTVDSVSGDTLTMTDGTPKASDAKVTLTIPSSARVRNDRRAASLSSLSAGERVVVIQLPRRTVVRAHQERGSSSSS